MAYKKLYPPGCESFQTIKKQLLLSPLLLLLLPPLARQGWLPASLATNVGNLGTFRYLKDGSDELRKVGIFGSISSTNRSHV